MGRPNKIRLANKEAEVRKLAAQGLTYRQIADALKKQGITVSHMAVGRFIQEETEERKAAARSVASSEAKESVPLVTQALRQLVVMNMTAARREFRGDGDDKKPKPRTGALALATKAAVAAARALHAVTMGEGPVNPLEDVQKEAMDILAAKRKREREREAAESSLN